MNEIQMMREIARLEEKINALRTIETGGIWTAYTPTWLCTTSNPAIGNGTLAGRYAVVGKVCHVKINLVAGNTTTFGSGEFVFTLPLTASGATETGSAKILDSGTAWFDLVCKLANTTQLYIPPVNATYPMAWTTSDSMWLSITYEIA